MIDQIHDLKCIDGFLGAYKELLAKLPPDLGLPEKKVSDARKPFILP